ncbi:CO dehydrogenase accessory protein CooC (nickel insertion) [Lachnospiraceae bacterium TWA4]|nr:CO dehydrogenase accessory protein CooC (nickel insertion) [Lachnospiraceae bacterium TWA4]
MIIIACGKGGCGKSTISSLLAREYARQGKNILVIDTDESNYGLHRQLGCELPKNLTEYFGGRTDIMKAKTEDAILFDKKWTISDIPSEYVSENAGVKLVAIGKIDEANEGCACAMGVLTKNLLPNLDLGENDVVLIDSEAGVEHFGRGVDNQVDHIMMVIDPSYESLRLAGKVGSMGAELGKEVFYVLNKADEMQVESMKEAMGDKKIAAVIYANRDVLQKGLMGEALDIQLDEITKLSNALA